nr:hypothetical protein [Tanacetum cinerariifolium]
MDGHTYVTRGYSNYADAPTQEGGYLYGSGQNVNWYVVETTTVERVRAPSGYTSYGGDPFKEYMPKYAPMNHHEGDYGSNYELSSAHGYLDQENLMNDFLKQLQIGASRPMKPSNLSGPNRYRPTSPNKYRPKSPTHGYPSKDAYPIRAQNMQGPAKYPLTFSTHGYPSKEDNPIKGQKSAGWTRYLPKTSPVHTLPSKEIQPVRTESISSPNKQHPSSPGSDGGQYAKAGEFSGPVNLLHNGPPKTQHPLSTPTNNINEAYDDYDHLAEPVTNSPRSDPKSGGYFSKFLSRAQPATGQATNRGLFRSNTIDSQEAIRKYNGASVP